MSHFSIRFDSEESLQNHIDQLIFSVREINTTVALLESQQPEWNGSHQTFLAIGEENTFQILTDEANSGRDFFQDFQDWLDQQTKTTVGWLGYDLKNGVEEGLHSQNPSVLKEPLLRFWQPEIWLSVDYEDFLIASDDPIPEIYQNFLHNPSSHNSSAEFGQWDLKHNSGAEEHRYKNIIREAKRHITEGTYYEINLSRQQTGTLSAHPYSLFQAMRKAGPVPMSAFIACGNFSVSCLSPERFLKKSGQKLISEPIKGTRKRGRTSEKDNAMKSELYFSEKERAENVMIVDLVRHDLNRVCKPGSVEVTELCQIRSYETVHQMVSVIEGEVKDKFSVTEILKAAFPMGSMTGAPKKSAMQHIERLENYKRGIYSGAIGYITPQQDFDFNVVIRSAISNNEKLTYPVGGAITADSDAKEEWYETEVKTQAFTSAKTI
jgi:para-aminobenzoate synthetase component 1